MNRVLLIILLIGAGSSLLAQSRTVNRGPFDVGLDIKSVYGRDNRLFVSSNGGVFYTDDRVSWTHVPYLMENVTKLMRDEGGNVYACGPMQVFKSEDNGETWSTLFFMLIDDVTGLSVFPNFPNSSISKDTLFLGFDSGLGYVVAGSFTGVAFHDFANKNIQEVFVEGNDVLAIDAANMLYVSPDRGVTWTSKQLPFTYDAYSTLTVSDNRIFIFNGDLWYSENWGEDWQEEEDGLVGLVKDFAVDHGKVYAATGTYPFVFLEEDNEWQALGSFPATTIAVHEDRIFTGSQGTFSTETGDLRESTDGGDTFDPVPVTGYTNGVISDLRIDADSNIYAVSNYAVYKKAKEAAIFEKFIPDVYGYMMLDGDFLYGPTLGGLGKFDKNSGDLMETISVAGGDGIANVVKRGNSIFVDTYSSGIWWIEENGNTSSFNAGLPGSIVIDELQENEGNLWLLSTGELYKSPNDETGWQKVEMDPAIQNPYRLFVNGNTILVGGIPGPSMVSHNGGDTWQPLGTNNVFINDIAYSDDLYYAVSGGTVFISYDNADTWIGKKVGTDETLNPFTILPTKDSVYISSLGRGIWSFKRLKLQQIFFEQADKTFGDEPFELNATTTEGLSVSYTTYSDKISISGNVVTIVKPGSVGITASQAGNSTVDAAIPVAWNFCIAPAQPIITTSSTDEKVTLTSSADTGNQWLLETEPIEGATLKTFDPVEEGHYSVVVFIDGCFSLPSADMVYPLETTEEPEEPEPPITGLEEPASGIGMYPNPAAERITIVTPPQSAIELVDVYGSTIESRLSAGSDEFKLQSLSAGVYLFKINTNGKYVVKKFLKQ